VTRWLYCPLMSATLSVLRSRSSVGMLRPRWSGAARSTGWRAAGASAPLSALVACLLALTVTGGRVEAQAKRPAKAKPSVKSSPRAQAKVTATSPAKPKPTATSKAPATSAPPATKSPASIALTWDRAAWLIETGLLPLEVDQLRKSLCIPGALSGATETRLRRAFDLWKLSAEAKTARIAIWTCKRGVDESRAAGATGQAGGPANAGASRSGTSTPIAPLGARSAVSKGSDPTAPPVPTPAVPTPPVPKASTPAASASTGTDAMGTAIGTAKGTASAAGLRRDQVERELASVLPMVPAVPVKPALPVVRELRTDAWWSFAAGGTASLAAAALCRNRATAPKPYGGTYQGTYHAAGSFVPSAFLVCTSSVLLSTAVVALPVLRTHAFMRYRDKMRGFAVDTVRYSASQRAYQEALRARAAIVDSVWAQRQATGDSVRASTTRRTPDTRDPSR